MASLTLNHNYDFANASKNKSMWSLFKRRKGKVDDPKQTEALINTIKDELYQSHTPQVDTIYEEEEKQKTHKQQKKKNHPSISISTSRPKLNIETEAPKSIQGGVQDPKLSLLKYSTKTPNVMSPMTMKLNQEWDKIVFSSTRKLSNREVSFTEKDIKEHNRSIASKFMQKIELGEELKKTMKAKAEYKGIKVKPTNTSPKHKELHYFNVKNGKPGEFESPLAKKGGRVRKKIKKIRKKKKLKKLSKEPLVSIHPNTLLTPSELGTTNADGIMQRQSSFVVHQKRQAKEFHKTPTISESLAQHESVTKVRDANELPPIRLPSYHKKFKQSAGPERLYYEEELKTDHRHRQDFFINSKIRQYQKQVKQSHNNNPFARKKLKQMELFHIATGYVPRSIVRALNNKRSPMYKETKYFSQAFNCCILFIDLTGFSSLCQRLTNSSDDTTNLLETMDNSKESIVQGEQQLGVEEIVENVNMYFDKIIKTVHKWGGDVEKFAGDAIVATFGSPLHDQQHAEYLHRKKYAEWGASPHKNEKPQDDKLSTDYQENRALLTELTEAALCCGYEIQKKYPCYNNLGINLALHMGVSPGKCYSIVVGGVRNEWKHLVAGEPFEILEECVQRSKTGEIVMTPFAQELVLESEIIESDALYLKSEFQMNTNASFTRHYTPGTPVDEFRPAPRVTMDSPIPSKEEQPVVDKDDDERIIIPKEDIRHQQKPAMSYIINYVDIFNAPQPTPPLADINKYSHPFSLKIDKKIRGFIPITVCDSIDYSQTAFLSMVRKITVVFIGLKNVMNYKTGDARKMNQAVTVVQQVLNLYEGTLNQVLCDEKGVSLIGAFGLPPFYHRYDSLRGVTTAMEISSQLRELRFDFTIGVQTGNTYCGNMGSVDRRDYSIIGHPVNMAARLMKHPSNGAILCGEELYLSTQNKMQWVACDEEIYLKGLEPVQTYIPVNISPVPAASVGSPSDESLIMNFKGAKHSPMLRRTSSVNLLSTPAHEISPSQYRLDTPPPKSISSVIDTNENHRNVFKKIVGRDIFANFLQNKIDELLQFGKTEKVITILRGGSGIGKTELLIGVLKSALQRHICCVYAEAVELEAHRPFFLWRQVLPQYLSTPEAMRIIPKHVDLMKLSKSDFAEVHDSVVSALGQWIIKMKKVLFVFKSLHFIDDYSLLVLIDIIHRYSEKISIFLSSKRLDSPTALHEEIFNRSITIKIPALTMKQTEKLILSIVNCKTIDSKLVKLISERADGNIQFIVILVKYLYHRGTLYNQNEKLVLKRKEALSEIIVPNTVKDIIRARWDRLDLSLQLILKIASVIGRRFSIAMLYDVYSSFNYMTEHGTNHYHIKTRNSGGDQLRKKVFQFQLYQLCYMKIFSVDKNIYFGYFIKSLHHVMSYNSLLRVMRKKIHIFCAEWLQSKLKNKKDVSKLPTAYLKCEQHRSKEKHINSSKMDYHSKKYNGSSNRTQFLPLIKKAPKKDLDADSKRAVARTRFNQRYYNHIHYVQLATLNEESNYEPEYYDQHFNRTKFEALMGWHYFCAMRNGSRRFSVVYQAARSMVNLANHQEHAGGFEYAKASLQRAAESILYCRKYLKLNEESRRKLLSLEGTIYKDMERVNQIRKVKDIISVERIYG